jgi:hypothetical protein
MSSIIELIAANMRAVNLLSGAASCQLVGKSSATTRAQMPPSVCLFDGKTAQVRTPSVRVTNWVCVRLSDCANSRKGRSSPHLQGRGMDESRRVTTCVGIDVSKDSLDVHVLPTREAFAVARDGKGLERALSHCRAASAKCRRLRNCQAAAIAVRHVSIAAARSARCVWAEVRWRWTLKVL